MGKEGLPNRPLPDASLKVIAHPQKLSGHGFFMGAAKNHLYSSLRDLHSSPGPPPPQRLRSRTKISNPLITKLALLKICCHLQMLPKVSSLISQNYLQGLLSVIAVIV